MHQDPGDGHSDPFQWLCFISIVTWASLPSASHLVLCPGNEKLAQRWKQWAGKHRPQGQDSSGTGLEARKGVEPGSGYEMVQHKK